MTSKWTRADALKVNSNDPTSKIPVVPLDFPSMSNDQVMIWDTMPLRTLENEIVSVDGWSVIFTLTVNKDPNRYKNEDGSYDIASNWFDRHGNAFIAYWYCRNGKDWKYGGRVMAEGVSPTTREWAGTPILLNDQGDIDLYYTCIEPNATLAKVSGKIHTNNDGVWLSGFEEVKPLLEADGEFYQTQEQLQGANFRDGSPFRDPADGRLYMVFEGNIGGFSGSHPITDAEKGALPPGHKEAWGNSAYKVGCIGIARALDEQGDEWEFLPPLVTALGVNDQLERPHFVFKDGKYYLFTISHNYTKADGLEMPDGVYGFVADSLFGNYEPLNGSGLVLGEPSEQPLQTYSHYVMQNGLTTSFIERVFMPNGVDYRIGGCLAPTLKLEIKGRNTYFTETLDYGYIPSIKNINLR